MAQMLVEGGRPEANMARAVQMIGRAAGQGCKVVVLPECIDLGWTSPTARTLAQPIPGRQSDLLASAAKEVGIYVAAGLTEKAGDRIYNAAVLISPSGEIIWRHRKINVLDIEQDLYSTGDRLGVVETPMGIIGINICADNFPDSLVFGHAQARMGAQVLLSPSAWAVKAGHDNAKEPYGDLWRNAYSQLCRLYGITMVGVSNVGPVSGGPWDGWKCIGCSMAIGPDGKVIAQGPYGESAEELIVVEVSPLPREVTGARYGGWLRERGYKGP